MVMRAGFLLIGIGSAVFRGCQALQFPSRVIDQRRATHSARGDTARPITSSVNDGGRYKHVQLNMAEDGDIWSQQKALLGEMSAKAELSLKQEQLAKFANRRNAVIGDTAFFTSLIFAVLWASFDNPFFSLSYTFGSVFGLAYAYGLGKYVETIGGSVDDTESLQGAGVGTARFAFLILLILFVGKFRSSGLLEIPSILGFFTYQLASLSQGLREIDD